MLSHRLQFHLLSQNPKKAFTFSPPSRSNPHSFLHFSPNTNNLSFPGLKIKTHLNSAMTSNSYQPNPFQLDLTEADIDGFSDVANKLADASGEVIRKYFRKKFEILDKEDLSPVTIADKAAEEAMISIILENFPSHAIFGEENGWRCKEEFSDFVWVLDPIDGTKSFITGKPLFGTLIALLYKGKPILGIIDQPVLRERWIGLNGRRTTLNGEEISTRACAKLSQAYLYTTSPHLFSGDAVEAFARVRSKVKVPLYGCDCYAYALLASGYVDLVIESGLKPYDFLALIPVIEGAGGIITDWKGHHLFWEASPESRATSILVYIKFSLFRFTFFCDTRFILSMLELEPISLESRHHAGPHLFHFSGFNVVAAGDKQIHQQALDALQWH